MFEYCLFHGKFLFLFFIAALLFAGCCWLAEQKFDDDEPRVESENKDSAYTQSEIKYFMEIALGTEYGTSTTVKKWSGTVRIMVKGNPTSTDIKTLNAVINELNELTDQKIHLKIVTRKPEITIQFVPVSEMTTYESNYVQGNWGFFYVWWRDSYEIYRGNILIGSDKPTQEQRNHLIREELTQSLGLLNDSWKHEGSIFYQGWTETQEFAEIDKRLIQILYGDKIKKGMTRNQVEKVLMKKEGR